MNLQKELHAFPKQNQIVKNLTLFFPSPQKKIFLVKPNFSPILAKEEKFGVKTNGSYKKRAIKELDSPVKTPSTNYFSPNQIKGKDLFGTKQDKKFCRKLDFDKTENNEYKSHYKITDIEMKNFFNMFNISDDNTIFNPIATNNISAQTSFQSTSKIKENKNKIGTEYTICKILKEENCDGVYTVKEKKSEKLYCIKKNSKNSKKNNFKTIMSILNDLHDKNNNKDNNELLLGDQFCMKCIDCWVEKENKYLYILLEFYPNGDILDFIEKLDKKDYQYSSNFYWDIIFEMICGLLYFHNKGYIHFDIKPTNFLVDNNGYIKLNDFDLSHKVEELSLLNEIIEGDSRYLSKELFDKNGNLSISNIDNRSDVFSLGLSLFEILFRVDLPVNGKLWKELRSENFSIPKEYWKNMRIEEIEEFLLLINCMITPIDKRFTLRQIINKFPQLTQRYEMLKINQYKKSCDTFKVEN